MLRHAEWTVLISDDVEVWLWHCHPEKGERARIIAKFRHAFDLLRAFGPAIGKPHVDRIEGEENLWEVRVGHRTGAYRAFFGLATRGSVILVVHGDVKKRDRFTPAVYRLAAQRVAEAVERYAKEGSERDA